jgi:glycosyltransferase involved in cell wall biosynthesis
MSSEEELEDAGFLRVPVLIPAYNPDEKLAALVRALLAEGFERIVVVNDGSDEELLSFFEALNEKPNVEVLRHVVNQGKGAALKTGFNYIYDKCPDLPGVITVDADGQHLPGDIVSVARTFAGHPEEMVLGVRTFTSEVPLRSRIGNRMTSLAVRLLHRIDLPDTQTGLRGIPMRMIPALLKVSYNRYEFELEVILVSKRNSIRLRQVPIETVYLENNRLSHFNPVLDSIRIYFILLRFVMASVVTALVDYSIFIAAYQALGSILMSNYIARSVAMMVNYILVRRMVFHSTRKVLVTFLQFTLLVAAMGYVSSLLIHVITATFAVNVVVAKLLSELLLYLVNFFIQKEVIFGAEEKRTDWDSYYRRPYPTAHFSRMVVGKALTAAIDEHAARPLRSIVELGGANSCFFERVRDRYRPEEYHVVDNNRMGLERFLQRAGYLEGFHAHFDNVLAPDMFMEADVVFSVGLIEHFRPEEVKRVIRHHFDNLRPGGIAVLSFPTPTFLYRATRLLSETAGTWIFHDERPLPYEEVRKTVEEHGDVVDKKLIWLSFLTQLMITVRKRGAAESSPPSGGAALPR